MKKIKIFDKKILSAIDELPKKYKQELTDDIISIVADTLSKYYGCDIKNCTKCKIRKYCKGLEDNMFEPYDCEDVLKIYIKDKENNK